MLNYLYGAGAYVIHTETGKGGRITAIRGREVHVWTHDDESILCTRADLSPDVTTYGLKNVGLNGNIRMVPRTREEALADARAQHDQWIMRAAQENKTQKRTDIVVMYLNCAANIRRTFVSYLTA